MSKNESEHPEVDQHEGEGVGRRVGRRTEDLDEQVDCLQVRELIVVRVDAEAEEQTGVAPIHNLVIPELGKGPLVSDVEAEEHSAGVRTSTKFDWYFWSLGATRRCTSPRSLT